ncbi:MAG TPA: hypothetical protein VHM70_10160 [Polyangiaceae bacterium]|nr:hypothetical protein [Polyangiaceae bacterium]
MEQPAQLAERRALGLLLGFGSVTLLGCFVWLPAIPQPEAYHAFADQRAWGWLPNALNVVSNAAFAGVGFAGLTRLPKAPALGAWDRFAFTIVFGGSLAVALGSGYYHWAPSSARLFWDRLPMTFVFTGLVSIMLRERISAALARRAWPLLALLGLASVVWWRVSDDLRLYGWLQYSSLFILGVLLFVRSHFDRERDFGWMVALYVAAKLAETFDHEIFSLGLGSSGHSLKHVLAAAALGCLVPHVTRRPREGLGADPSHEPSSAHGPSRP